MERNSEASDKQKVTSKRIELEFPIKVPKEGGGDMEISVLVLNRVKGRDLDHIPAGLLEKGGKVEPQEVIPFIASLANIPLESAREIDFVDLIKAIGALEDFLTYALSPKTGKK